MKDAMLTGRVETGLDRVLTEPSLLPRGARLGLLCHAASVNRDLVHAATLLCGHDDFHLSALFGPQHGYAATCQDNMIESPHGTDRATGLLVFSLYSETRKPTPAMLSGIDAMVVDLQDVGCRVYTYIWTLSLVLEACAEASLPVWVLDRPNPLGNRVEGNRVAPGFESFVGRHAIPMRHGMTIGEFARFYAAEKELDLSLTVVSMENYKPGMAFGETGLPWVMPSPNMPALDTAKVYPGMVLLEGTNLSEGRGTTRPFEIFGASFMDAEALCAKLNSLDLPGVVFRPVRFEPTFHKFHGQVCGGAQIHVIDQDSFQPYLTGLHVLHVIRGLYPDGLAWLPPPYEYEQENLPIDILTGDPGVREAIDGQTDLAALAAKWPGENGAYETRKAEVALY